MDSSKGFLRFLSPPCFLATCLSAFLALVIVALALPTTLDKITSSPFPVRIDELRFGIVHRSNFIDLIPFRAKVAPRETLYIDAVDGGRVDRVLVEPGDLVQKGQALIELSNTTLALQVIQQESQLNQAISQLQQNEIALEQNRLSNERALADIDYQIVRLQRSAARHDVLAASGADSLEQRDLIADELSYYRQLRSIQTESGRRQAELCSRLLPDIQQLLVLLRHNLGIVHDKLDGLVIRPPVGGRVSVIDLKVGENRSPGQRLAELTPDRGMRLSASIAEIFLGRVHPHQSGTVSVAESDTRVIVRRVSPKIRDGVVDIELDFDGGTPPGLVSGATLTGHLASEGNAPTMIVPTEPFLERTGGRWVFVVADDNRSAHRRAIQIGRHSPQQIEILSGLSLGEKVITSDYAGIIDEDHLLFVD